MCLLVYLPKGTTLTDNEVYRAFYGNPDGSGIAWWDGKGWKIRKMIMTPEGVIETLRVLGDAPKVVHFRLGTSGETHPLLTHPFITPSLAIFQNGIWSEYYRFLELTNRRGIKKHWLKYNRINRTPPTLNSDTKLMGFLLYLNQKTKGKYRKEVKRMLYSSGRLIILKRRNPEPILISHFYTDDQGRKFSNMLLSYPGTCSLGDL